MVLAPSTSHRGCQCSVAIGGGILMDERSFVSSPLDHHHMITPKQPGYPVWLAQRNKLSAHRHKGDGQGNAPCPSKSFHDGTRWHHQHFARELSQSADLWPVSRQSTVTTLHRTSSKKRVRIYINSRLLQNFLHSIQLNDFNFVQIIFIE